MKSRRILVVDDEQAIVDLLRDALTERGYGVDSALTAESALEQVRQTIYDAAIIDFNLPDMDGVMLHRQIRQMDEELSQKTLFTSGLVQSEKNLDYYAAYGGGFLSKPFDVRELVAALDSLWRGRRRS